MIATTLTGEAWLDAVLNLGLGGLGMVLIYYLALKKNVAGESLIHVVNSLKAIEKRLSTIEQKEDVREAQRERHLAVFEQLTQQISKTQTMQGETQQAILRILERQVVLLDQVDRKTEAIDDKLDECRREIARLRETAACKVGEATVKANIKTS